MHAGEAGCDEPLVRGLLAAQFPQWADLALSPVDSAGTDNALFRLGADMVVRMPRIHRAADQVEKQHRWLPRLAPLLPLALPVPLAHGLPGAGYSWHWSVYRWLEGENALSERIADPRQAAMDLAQFITALRRIDPAGGPAPGAHNSFRGAPLSTRDTATRTALATLFGTLAAAGRTVREVAASGGPADSVSCRLTRQRCGCSAGRVSPAWLIAGRLVTFDAAPEAPYRMKPLMILVAGPYRSGTSDGPALEPAHSQCPSAFA